MINLNSLPIEWIVGAITAFVAFVAVKLKIHNAKQQGKNEQISEQAQKTLDALIDIQKQKEKVKNEADKIKSSIPDNWGDVNKLREKGKRKLSEISTTNVRRITPKKVQK